ncbi:MAG: ribonuclease P protein component [Acidimicrobiia bacterium]|nr:ribonuclease P protein component [Acidimicrobiia bacterium]MXZ77802.1 ribonuclease P protein component [Acidimicrobiia bacterium]MXZ84276.1 ribonuclease P protein component [Acidimicrobiia bacterium]MYB73578.1 ribonuclease P protein component [Acidimicrobiia bacterium]MYE72655.1 ribonuclease P protein component [Acidimicrobiia bacterium]
MSASDDDKRRTGDHQCSSAPRPQKAVGLIERLRGRSTFARLRADGDRAEDGLLWVRHLPDPSAVAARVAYAVPRQLGSAVIRNKIRRRLREAVRELDRETPSGLAAGLYLIGTRRGIGRSNFADLRFSLAACLSELDRKAR